MTDVPNDGNWYFWYATTAGGQSLGWLGYSQHIFFEPVEFMHPNLKDPTGVDWLEMGNFVTMDERLLFRAPDFTPHGSKFFNTDTYKVMWVWGSSAGEVNWDPNTMKVTRVGGMYDGYIMCVYRYLSGNLASWESPNDKNAEQNHIIFDPRWKYQP
ncbi:MAG TPA: hypothetical protein VF571_06850 [Pyrinomonadaceae bacterium]|jgi:hypothetical protein